MPSLTSHAFFRPMSSQRLQAQRAGRQSRAGQASSSDDGSSEAGSNTNRLSYGSNSAMPQSTMALEEQEEESNAPPSRGTEVTDRDGPDPPRTDTSVVGNGTIQSRSGSATPLQKRSANIDGTLESQNTQYQTDSRAAAPAPKSPRMFRSKFLSSTGTQRDHRTNEGAERLASVGSSPTPRKDQSEHDRKTHLGHNFEYYSGNTRFCWGGRLQNTRDRPVNLATGLFVVVPAGLFLGFSYVLIAILIEVSVAKFPSRAPWLWRNVSPAIPILFAYLFLICISSFIHASFTDPGVSSSYSHSLSPAAHIRP